MNRIELSIENGVEFSIKGRVNLQAQKAQVPVRQVLGTLIQLVESFRTRYVEFLANDGKIMSVERLALTESLDEAIQTMGTVLFEEFQTDPQRGRTLLAVEKGRDTKTEFSADLGAGSWSLRGPFRKSDVETRSIRDHITRVLTPGLAKILELVRDQTEDAKYTAEERRELRAPLIDLLHRTVYLRHFIETCQSTT